MDHFSMASLGGVGVPDEIRPACPFCRSSGARPLRDLGGAEFHQFGCLCCGSETFRIDAVRQQQGNKV